MVVLKIGADSTNIPNNLFTNITLHSDYIAFWGSGVALVINYVILTFIMYKRLSCP